MPPSNDDVRLKLGEEEIPCTNTFKYIGSIFAAEGGTEADCKNRVRLSWNKWRETTVVICDKNVPVKLKVKIYQTVIKPTMLWCRMLGHEKERGTPKSNQINFIYTPQFSKTIQGCLQCKKSIDVKIKFRKYNYLHH